MGAQTDDARSCVERMVARQSHRGPDDRGIEVVSQTPSVVLGHARLSIIDLSPDGHQPMLDPQTGNVIVFNGEIYNFKLLRAELEKSGYRFHTKSDTEVLLKAYAAWGDACCERLRGIFAFAIWDARARRLFVARDQLGVKPFYYCQMDDGFAFASEVRALLASGKIGRVLDKQGLYSYLAYGSVQEPFTLVKDIHSLPAGSCGGVDEGVLTFHRYWNAAENVSPEVAGLAYNEANKKRIYEQADQILEEAVSLQMVSDVTLGAFLSGGVDSSAIVSLMRQGCSEKIKTFSIVFDSPEFDERKYAAMVAAKNRTDHAELVLSGSMVRDHLTEAIEAYDQPSVDGLNTWFVSKIVKEAGVTVALSGVGGDELFVGYGGFKKILQMETAQHWLRPIPAFIGRALEHVTQSEMQRKVAQMIGYPYPAYFLSRRMCSVQQIRSLLNPLYASSHLNDWKRLSFGNLIEDGNRLDDLSRLSLFEMGSYMLSTLLRDTDQMSMAHNLEVRVPLIDHHVVNFMLSVPPAFKTSPTVPKPILVHSAGEGLPMECVVRPKQGFTLPFEQWLKSSLMEEMRSLFLEGACHDIFSGEGMRHLWDEFISGRVSWSRIWGLFVLNHWLVNNRIAVG